MRRSSAGLQWWRRLGLGVAALAVGGCGEGGGDAPDGPVTVEPGTGTIAGAYEGRSFSSVGASYRIGAPDDKSRTIVIYVFDKALGCSEIGPTGWDETVADGTQSLELKLIGKTPAVYAVSEDATPASGQASVNYTVTSTVGAPIETGLASGNVTLEAIDTAGGATGSFDLVFPSGETLKGTFATTYCAGGHEP